MKFSFYISSFVACAVLALTTGCASGGFKLTRQYAGWVNSQHIIIRIILYILTAVVFAVTMLIDLVIYNTMDFWNGRVSAGDYQFKDGEKTYLVRHFFEPGTQLKRSFIEVQGPGRTLLQTVQLLETPKGEIEMFVDGQLRTRVQGIQSVPIATIFDLNGHVVSEHLIPAANPTSVGWAPFGR